MLRFKFSKHSRGFTLLEVAIGLAVGVVVLAGVLKAFQAFNSSNIDSLRSARLDHELRAMMQVISNDVRRAGYWADAMKRLQ